MANFDNVTERRGTYCLKYDFAKERGLPEDVLPFWVADMDFPAPKPVIDELVKRSQHGIFGYTDIKEDYAETLSDWFKKRHGWQITPKSLVITPGVVFAICAAIRAFTEKGDAVLINPPVYYPFSASVKQNGRNLVESPLVLNNGKYEFDFEDFEEKIVKHKVKLFILCSPHNPVGRVWRREELFKIADVCLKHKVLVIADEIHADFVRPKFSHTVFASLSSQISDITITCTAPSKTFNFAGLQVSNIFIDNKDIRKKFQAEILASGYSQPNALGMFATKAAYEHGEEWLTELLAYLEGNLDFVKKFFESKLPKVKLIEPEGTYLLWLDLRMYGLSDRELDNRIINKGKLWLDPGHIFGAGGSGFQRINMACPKSILEEGLRRLAQALK